jgi:NAD(P)-dependent dehydrogenase (short-subunit alcohol dehydrogenase family)
MLGLDLALDADLGIDSIKRVEILSALQERLPDAPAVKPEHLGTLHTLRHLAAFLANGDGRIGEVSPPVAGPAARPEGPASALERSVVRVAPLDAARPRARLPDGAEVWITSDDADLAARLGERLHAHGLRPRLLPCAALAELPCPPALGGLVLIAPPACDDAFLRDALLIARGAAAGLRSGRGAFLTVSRLDGAFGLETPPGREPLDGALAGLAKTAAHEWPQVRCKAVDLGPGFASPDEAADALLDELLTDGPVEVGVSPGRRVGLERVVAPLPDAATAPLAPGEVVVVSGGARGVTAEAALALAHAWRPTLVLIGRSAPPAPEPAALAGLTAEADLKREINRLAGGALSPREVGDRCRDLLARREVRDNLARLEAAGCRVRYLGLDVRDAEAVRAALGAVRRELGPVRGLVHGAGVLADARLEDKTAEQFDRVWGTKVGGLRSLLAALPPDDLRCVALFSSTTARLGRAGQADYAMANEALNKIARQLGRRLPACRVVAVNWGPWDGGMVGPGLKKLFAAEGVGLIPTAAGADFLARELAASWSDAEVVVLAAPPPPPEPPAAGPLPVAFERVLDVAGHPLLASHVLDGRPVLPLALTLEWLAHAAMVQHPGLHFHGCDGLRVLHGVALDDGPVTIRVGAGKATRREGLFVVPAELHADLGGRDVPCARADVLLAEALPPAPPAAPLPPLADYPTTMEDAYRDLLFHGPDLHGLESVEGCGPEGIAAWTRTAPPPPAWMSDPLRQRWLADPLALDAAFQALILWSLRQRGVPCLPTHAARYRQYRRAFPERVRLAVRVVRQGDRSAVADVDFVAADGGLVARLEGHESALDGGLARAFRARAAAAGVP